MVLTSAINHSRVLNSNVGVGVEADSLDTEIRMDKSASLPPIRPQCHIIYSYSRHRTRLCISLHISPRDQHLSLPPRYLPISPVGLHRRLLEP